MTHPSLALLIHREVSVEEVRRALHDPMPDDEREEILALHRWFVARYPTAEARLAYVREALARWTRSAGTARQPRQP